MCACACVRGPCGVCCVVTHSQDDDVNGALLIVFVPSVPCMCVCILVCISVSVCACSLSFQCIYDSLCVNKCALYTACVCLSVCLRE